MAKQTFLGNIRSAPVWMKDFVGRYNMALFPAKVDATAFNDAMSIKLVVGAAGAAGNATSIPVAAVTLATQANTTVIAAGAIVIPAGTTLYFGASKKLALTTANVVVGDTAVTVQALPTALVSGDTAYYSRFGTELIPSGTLVGRTYASRASDGKFIAVTDANVSTFDELFLTAFDAVDVKNNEDIELVRNGNLVTVAENYLPDYTAMAVTADEVQTVGFTTAASAGTFAIQILRPTGVWGSTGPLAFNASLATIQTALDLASGVVNGVVGTSAGSAAPASTPTPLILTFSGTGYTGVGQKALVHVDNDSLTGNTAVTVTQSTLGGTPRLSKIRSLYACILGKN